MHPDSELKTTACPVCEAALGRNKDRCRRCRWRRDYRLNRPHTGLWLLIVPMLAAAVFLLQSVIKQAAIEPTGGKPRIHSSLLTPPSSLKTP